MQKLRAIGPTVGAGEVLKHKHTHSKTIYMDILYTIQLFLGVQFTLRKFRQNNKTSLGELVPLKNFDKHKQG